MCELICLRLGCHRPAVRSGNSSKQTKRKPYCSLGCRYWDKAFAAFMAAGAAIDRDAVTDFALFDTALSVGVRSNEGFHITLELYDAYGRP